MTLGGKLLILLGVALVTLCIVTAWRATRQEARAEAVFPRQGQIIEIDGTAVHGMVMGQGPDLVLIHGASGNLRDFTFSLAPRLAQHYRVIVLDRPGLGYTDRLGPGGATLIQQAELLSRAATQLGATRPVVMGQSYGGAVALAWAVHFPDRLSALVPVAAPSHPWETPLDPFYRVTSHPLGRALVVPLLTAFVSEARVARAIEAVFDPQSAPEGYGDHIGAPLTLRRASLRENALQRANILSEIKDLSQHYEQISVPTEILHGSEDTTVWPDLHSGNLARRIPGAHLTLLPGIGHMPQHVAQDAIVAAIDRASARAGLR